MTKKRRSSQAVSEVVGVILLLGITIGLFGFLNYIVFSYSFQPSAPSVSLIGSISIDETTGEDNVVIMHNGGQALNEKTQIFVRVGNIATPTPQIFDDVLNDINNDDKWNFGETVVCHTGTSNQFIQVSVVDSVTNTLILSAVLQQP